MPETDQLTTFESMKQAAASILDKLPNANTLKKGMALAGSIIAMSGVVLEHELVFPDKAVAEQQCTTETTSTTAPDGTVTTTETEHCTDTSGSSDDSSGNQQPSKPKPDKPDNQNGGHKHGKTHHGKTVHGPKVDKTDSQKNFPGYDMGDTAFTDGNGCFITSAASALRRETGDAHITPRSIYYPALKKMWSPSTGVKGGLLFDALPSIASHFDVKVYKTNFKGAVKAIKNDDEVMMLAANGHFTSQGHYMDAWKVVNGNRLVIDDPNGKGKHGDSERPGGWSGSELQRAGIIGYRVLHLRGH